MASLGRLRMCSTPSFTAASLSWDAKQSPDCRKRPQEELFLPEGLAPSRAAWQEPGKNLDLGWNSPVAIWSLQGAAVTTLRLGRGMGSSAGF